MKKKEDTYRARPYEYSFCASEEEKEKIDRNIEMSGFSKREFFVSRAINVSERSDKKEVMVIENGPEIRLELIRTGTNINQAARALNEIKQYIRKAYEGDWDVEYAVANVSETLDKEIAFLLESVDYCNKAIKSLVDLGGRK